MERIDVSVPAIHGRPFADFLGSFGKINVILGANGSGKSSLLTRMVNIHEIVFPAHLLPVYIEGGRVGNFDISVGMNSDPQVFAQPDLAKQQYLAQKNSSLSARLNKTFKILRAMEQAEKIAHSDAVDAWQKGDKLTPVPVRPITPIKRLEQAFQTIFPDISITINPHDQLFVERNGVTYPAAGMSEGQRQIFTLIADLIILIREPSVFLIDEPELNLHPTLAEDFWALIEGSYPDSIFVYATHSINFALRQNVDTVHVLGLGQVEPRELQLEAPHLRPFLGSISRVQSSRRCLFVEGEDASFDKLFYQWLLEREDVLIQPIGSSSEVKMAASRQGLWQRLSPEALVAGVVDQDFRGQPVSSTKGRLVTLVYHEAESYLCHPQLVVRLNAALSNTEKPVTQDEVLSVILKDARSRLLYVALQRVFFRSYINLSLSVEGKGLSRVSDLEAVKSLLADAAEDEAEKAATMFSSAGVLARLDEEISFCQAAIDSQDPNRVLMIFEGKRLLTTLCRLAGCATPLSMLMAVRKHFRSTDFEFTAGLQAQFAGFWDPPAAG